MLTVVSILLVLSFISPFLYKIFRGITNWIISSVIAVSFILFISSGRVVLSEGFLLESYEWFSSANINLEFYVDGLGFLFGIIVLGIGALIVLYSGYYLKGKEYTGRFYLYIVLFAASMLGLVISGNLILMFIFWELTGISSFFLIGYYFYKEESRISAQQALLVTGFGGLALLAGFILIYLSAETLSIKELLTKRELIVFTELYPVILILILTGVFTKSAQVPFHFWLPNAMVAPAPISAYLHSATMVKAGIFLLMRLYPVLGDTGEWKYLLSGFGIFTMLMAGFISIKQTDLKKILAYSTVSALGLMVTLMGISTQEAIQAAVVFLLAHALYKGSLFLIVGLVEHSANSRNINELSGLYKTVPLLGIISFGAAASQSGLPLFFGFLGKELTYSSSIDTDFLKIFLPLVLLITNIFMVCAALMSGVKPFIGEYEKENIKIDKFKYISPLILSLTGFILFFIPGITDKGIVAPAVSAISGLKSAIKLSLWHGFNLPLLLSVITLVCGYYAFRYRDYFKLHLEDSLLYYTPSSVYHSSISVLKKTAYYMTRILQNGYLRNYLIVIFSFTLIVMTLPILIGNKFIFFTGDLELQWYEIFLYSAMIISAIFVTVTKSRLSAIAALGIVGFGVAVIFIMHGAPDIAITQFAIEVLTVILFVIVLFRLPRFSNLSERKIKIRDMIISFIAGAVVFVLLILILNGQMRPLVSDFYTENSWTLANGRNIVNVILVDFRAMDTFGEITVLAVAAFGIFALLKLTVRNKEKENK
jgi:multicomponent Na+:H+ antiporter subunit A